MDFHDVGQNDDFGKHSHTPSTPAPEPWYKRYPSDYQRGTRRLSLAARGAYSDIIDLMFIEGGPLPDDNRYIACALHITGRQWLKVKAELFEAGKLYVRDGLIVNPRASAEISERTAKRPARRRQAVPVTKMKPDQDQKSASFAPKVGPVIRTLPNEIKGGKTTEAEAESDTEITTVESYSSVVGKQLAAAPCPSVNEYEELTNRLVEAAGPILSPIAIGTALKSVHVPEMWISEGCDLQLDIIPTLRHLAATRKVVVQSWSYFSQAVVQARDQRKAGLPSNGTVAGFPRKSFASAQKIQRAVEAKGCLDALQSGVAA